MSKTIDERVVSMQFDNRQFESNVKTTMGTLGKLKQSLNLQGASKGLENINYAAKNCNLNPLGNAVETVKLKFSALQVMAVTALANITNSAINTGKSIIKAFTIDPVKTGLQEYETQINAVQTILANTESKGTTLDDVNEALDTLNAYADKTIYNFTEMTRNIGTFTAAGIDLETSVNAIQGIANLAAISGSNSQQASTAMYQLSQALASGTVKLMDWNSVVNAGMGGQVFQDALKETARVHDIAIDDMIKKHGSFRETLQEGWLTSEILTETLQKFTLTTEGLTEEQIEANRQMLKSKGYTDEQIDSIFKLGETATDAATKVKTFTQLMDTLKEAAQSGWTQTWELIIGDFEQAKELWTGISDLFGEIINNSANKRNELLGGALNSKWDKMLKKINDAGVSTEEFEKTVEETAKKHGYPIDQMIERYGSLEEAIRSNAFPVRILDEALGNLSTTEQDLSKVTAGMKKGFKGEDVKQLQTALKDLGYDLSKFGVDGIFGKETEAAIRAFQEAKGLKITGIVDEETLAALKEAGGSAVNLRETIGDLVDGLDELGGRELLIQTLKNLFEALAKPIRKIKEAWRETFSEMTSEQLYGTIKAIHDFSEKLIMSDENAEKVKRTFKGLFAVLNIVKTVIGGGINFVFKALSKILGLFNLNILDVAAGMGDALVAAKEWLLENNRLVKWFDKGFEATVKWAKGVKDWVKAFSKTPEVQEKIRKIKDAFSNGFSVSKDFFSGGLIKIKEFIDRLKDLDGISLENIKKALKDFKDNVLGYFVNFDPKSAFSKLKDSVLSTLRTIGTFLSSIGEKLGITGEKFNALKDKIIEFYNILKEKLGDKKGSLVAIGSLLLMVFVLFKLKAAVGQLLDAITSIGGIVKKVVNGITGVFSSIQNFFNSYAELNKAKASEIKSRIVMNFAKSILILAGALFVISKIPAEDAKRSLIIMGIMAGSLLVMIGIFKLLDLIPARGATDISSFAKMMAKLGVALLLLSLSIKMLGNMDRNALVQGGIAVASFLGIITVMMFASRAIPSTQIDRFGKMIKKISSALLMLSLVVLIFGKMKTETLVKGALAVTYFLGLMSAMMATSKLISGDVNSFGKMIKRLSAALLTLSLAVLIFGKMKTETLIKGAFAVTYFLGLMVGIMALTKMMEKEVANFGRIMFGISAGLLMMAVAVGILGHMKTETLIKGGLAVAAFTGIVVALMAATRLLGANSVNAGKIGLLMLSMSASILLLMGSILILSQLDGKDLTKAMAAIAGIGVIFAGLVAVTHFAKDVKMGTLVGMAVTVMLMAATIAALTLVDSAKLYKATAALTAVMAMFSVLMVSSKFADSKGIGFAAGMVIVIGALGYVLSKVANMAEDGDKALKVALGLSAVIVALSAASLLLAKAGTNTKAAFVGVGVFAALLGVVSLFAGIALWQLPNIARQLSKFMKELEPFMSGMKKIDESFVTNIKLLGEAMSAFGSAGIKMGIANLLPGNAISQMAEFIKTVIPIVKGMAVELSDPDLNINYDNLTAVMTAVKDLAEAASTAPSAKAAFAITKWGVGGYLDLPQLENFKNWITGVVPLIKDVALELSTSGVNINTENLTAIIDAISSLAEAADKAPGVELTAAFGKFGKGFGGGFSYKKSDLEGFAKFIASSTTAMKDFVKSLGEQKDDDGNVIEAATTEVNVDFVTDLVNAIKILAEAADSVPADVVAKFAGGGLFRKFRGFGVAGGYGDLNVTTDLGGFANFIGAALTTVTEFMNNLTSTDSDGNSVPKFTQAHFDMVKSLCESISLIAKAAEYIPYDVLGTASGGGGGLTFGRGTFGLSAGYGSGNFTASPMINAFTTFITDSLEALKGFVESITGEDGTITMAEGAAETAKKLCEAVSAIGGAMEFVPTAADFKGVFGGAVGGMVGGVPVAGVGGGKIEGSIIPMLQEFKQWIIDVLEVLPGFAENVHDTGVTDSDVENIKGICEAATKIAEAASNAPKETQYEGIFGNYVKKAQLEELTTWAADIIPLISEIVSGTYTTADGTTVTLDNVSTVNMDTFKSICEAAKTIAEAAKLAPQEETYSNVFGTWVSTTDLESTVEWFSGVYDLLNGPEGLIPKLAANPVDKTALAGLNGIVEVARVASDAIFNISMSLNIGNVNTQTFTEVATALGTFYDEIVNLGIDMGVVSNAATSIASLKDVLVALQGFDYDSVDTGDLTIKLEDIGDSVGAFHTKMKEVGDTSEATTQVSTLATMLGGLAAIDFSGASSFQTALEDLGNTGVDEFVKAFDDGSDKAKKAAEDMAKNAADAVENSQSIVTRFKSAGRNLVLGFAQGISDYTWIAEAKARAMANKAAEAAEKELDEHSPSKVGVGIGRYFTMGVANGIMDFSDKVENSSVSVARTAIDGTKNVIARIADSINTDIDTQPTIRPVLDLSNVKNGAGSINGMFDMNPSIITMSNVGVIGKMMNTNQNGTNNDVISAIENLGRKMTKSTGDVYNVNGITYDDGSNISDAVKTLVRAAKMERRR